MTGNHENKKYNYITLGNLAKLANIGRDTLSFYSRKGLIRPVYVGENGYKYFLPEQVQTIQFIRFYRKLDFPLETIQNMLDSMEEAKDIKSKDMKNGNPAKDSHSAENADPADQNDAFENQLQYLQRKIEDFRTAAEFLKTEKDFHRYISIHRNDEPFFFRSGGETVLSDTYPLLPFAESDRQCPENLRFLLPGRKFSDSPVSDLLRYPAGSASCGTFLRLRSRRIRQRADGSAKKAGKIR